MFLLRIFVLCFFSCKLLAAAELIVEAYPQEVEAGQALQLKISLLDANPKGELDLTELKQFFKIIGYSNFSSLKIINGVKQSVGWNIILIAKITGKIMIPAISVNTNQGLINSEPVLVNIIDEIKSDADTIGFDQNKDIFIEATAAKNKVYLNESIVVKVKIYNSKHFVEPKFEDIQAENAIIQQFGKPKVYSQVVNGKQFSINEIVYIAMPLKAGDLTILPATLHGSFSQSRFNYYDLLTQHQPFMVKSNNIVLEILPAEPNNNPWMPLYNLAIMDSLQGAENPKIGEPITRSIKISADGTWGNQIPSLSKEFQQLEGIKTYLDTPQTSESFDGNLQRLQGIREENYTFIPQQAGDFILPEVSIRWWDLQEKKSKLAMLPSKKIIVTGGAVAPISESNLNSNLNQNNNNIINNNTNTNNTNNWVLYSIISGLILVILVLIFCVCYLLFRKNKSIITEDYKSKSNIKSNIKSNLKLAQEIIEPICLRDYILVYSQDKWGVPKNIFFDGLIDYLIKNNFDLDKPKALQLFRAINAALYAQKNTDIKALISDWEEVRKSVRYIKMKSVQRCANSKLNPT